MNFDMIKSVRNCIYLDSSEKLVLYTVLTYGAECFASASTLAADTGFARPSVARILARLEGLGAIERVGRTANGVVRYRPVPLLPSEEVVCGKCVMGAWHMDGRAVCSRTLKAVSPVDEACSNFMSQAQFERFRNFGILECGRCANSLAGTNGEVFCYASGEGRMVSVLEKGKMTAPKKCAYNFSEGRFL